VSLIGARPHGDKKKGADTGIDGYLCFSDEKGKTKRAIVQVKSGNTSVKDVRDLSYVIEREKSEIGILITLERPTSFMVREAVPKGFYKSDTWNKEYPRVQILTIEELLSGKQPALAPTVSPYKEAQRANTGEQLTMEY
jgi:site-specific DNA-methyltransferase (adenine-specific)